MFPLLTVAVMFVRNTAAMVQVFGYEGGEATVSCPYGAGYESYEKYLCRNSCGSDADVVGKTTQANTSKYSTYDDKQKHAFTATITKLQSSDAGTYKCGVSRSMWDYYPAEVKLDVLKGE